MPTNQQWRDLCHRLNNEFPKEVQVVDSTCILSDCLFLLPAQLPLLTNVVDLKDNSFSRYTVHIIASGMYIVNNTKHVVVRCSPVFDDNNHTCDDVYLMLKELIGIWIEYMRNRAYLSCILNGEQFNDTYQPLLKMYTVDKLIADVPEHMRSL